MKNLTQRPRIIEGNLWNLKLKDHIKAHKRFLTISLVRWIWNTWCDHRYTFDGQNIHIFTTVYHRLYVLSRKFDFLHPGYNVNKPFVKKVCRGTLSYNCKRTCSQRCIDICHVIPCHSMHWTNPLCLITGHISKFGAIYKRQKNTKQLHLFERLIDLIVFYAISAIFQPLNCGFLFER